MATLKQKIGQQTIIGISGKSLTEDEKSFIIDQNIGGIILFSRNIESPQQLHKLNTEIQSLRHKMADKAPLFIAIDMEGGRVARLKAPFTQWPPIGKMGALDSPSVAFKFAESMGTELQAIGINIDFAPCVDVLTNPKNELIGDRALSSDPEVVGKLASAIVRGYIKSGVIPCAKHFPGHGNTIIDSHFDLPVEEVSLETLISRELVPFKKTFRARLDLVMTAHILYKNIDPEWPATLSKRIIEDLLRKEAGYRNLVISDDLDMKALRKLYDIDKIAVRAVEAGCNILLYCNEPESPKIGLAAVEKAATDKSLSEETIEKNYQAVLALKKSKISKTEPLPLNEAARIIGHPDHLALSKAITAGDVPEGLTT